MTWIKWASTPVENFSGISDAEMERFRDECIKLMKEPRRLKMKPVEWAKSTLGKQDYTHTGSEFRFWVWESKTCSWRLFVSNIKGICFEVNENVEHDEVMQIWDSFVKKVGM